MSNIRKTHPGYFNVAFGLAFPWYIGLGVGFLLSKGTTAASSQTYSLVKAYIPLQVWGVVYLLLGFTLLTALLVPKIPHRLVRACCCFGLMLTTFWLALFVVALFTHKMDLVTVIPAWATVALVEWSAFREPEHGPERNVR